jgi:hypothetical protein
MKHKHSNWPPVARRPIGRIALAFLGLLIVSLGSLTLASGKLRYSNWWGGEVFVPFAIFGGTVAIVAGIRGKPFKGK